MSSDQSDSDLDFESADEGLKGEDIDTSDLDISDKEDETTKSIPEPKVPSKVEIETKVEPKVSSKVELEPKVSSRVEIVPKVSSKVKVESPVVVEVKKEVVTTGWDADAEFSDIEDTDLETHDQKSEPVDRLPKITGDIKGLKLFGGESTKPVASSWSGGWSNFSSVISSVLETVEATIGAPDPGELAKLSAKEEKEVKDVGQVDDGDQEWFTMGNQIVNGGLDMLETVGRKTFKVISDKDQNLKQTREFLNKGITTQKPNLSQVLRDAHESRKSQTTLQKSDELASFQFYFEEFKGSAHLEALESLSRQSNVKLEVLKTPGNLKLVISKLDEVFDSAKLNDESESEQVDDFFEAETFLKDFKMLVKKKVFDVDQFEVLINNYAKKCHFFMDLEKIVYGFRTSCISANELEQPDDLRNESIKCFCLIASRVIELYHKSSETILTEQKASKKTNNSIENAESIYQITKLCLRSVTIVADDFCRKCRGNNQVIADIYLEASNATTYIADAFLLLAAIFKANILE